MSLNHSCIIRVHTQFFLHSLYALDAVLVSLVASGPVRTVHQVGLLVENALEVVLAHGSVAAVSVEALDALGGSLLAGVEPFALALAANLLEDKVSDWNRQATGRKKRGVSGRGGYLPVELLLGRVVPRVLAFVSLGRHLVGCWCCGASAWD